jgi:pSer/pThr/pTyr-binding forkhead associated (FHA) protein
MTEPRTLEYRLLFDGDAIPLHGAVTIGRHLDNDIVIAGEDVLDFHLRIELPSRGPIAVPLDDALIHLNDHPLDLPAGIMPGDRLDVGQSILEVEADSPEAPEAESWQLHPAGAGEGLPIHGVLTVGRDPGCDLRLSDPHASRRHAQLLDVGGTIWLQDLGSANGTFINGERIRGARRVFHGDEIRFDQTSCQLLGRGADLTPARAPAAGDRQPFAYRAERHQPRAGDDTLEFAAIVPETSQTPPLPGAGSDAGAYLVWGGGPGQSGWHRLPMGRTVVGRQADCDLQLRDRTVSGRHAELILRPEGATLTDLMSSNGTLCNGRRVQSVRLEAGDRIQVGRSVLVYREIATDAARHRRLRWLTLAALVVATGTALLLWL